MSQTSGADFRTYWQIAGSAPFVNGVQAVTSRFNAILDSGTTLIIVSSPSSSPAALANLCPPKAPAAAAAEFWAKVPGSAKLDDNFWTFPCDSPPTVTFGLTRVIKKWEVNPDDFNLGYIEGDESRCMGAVATQNLGLGTSWLLGDSFREFWRDSRSPKEGRVEGREADETLDAVMNWYTIYVSSFKFSLVAAAPC